jgi:hypothetical protein
MFLRLIFYISLLTFLSNSLTAIIIYEREMTKDENEQLQTRIISQDATQHVEKYYNGDIGRYIEELRNTKWSPGVIKLQVFHNDDKLIFELTELYVIAYKRDNPITEDENNNYDLIQSSINIWTETADKDLIIVKDKIKNKYYPKNVIEILIHYDKCAEYGINIQIENKILSDNKRIEKKLI